MELIPRAPEPTEEERKEQERADALRKALADHFGREPEDLLGYALVVEHVGDEDTISLSFSFTTGTPFWRMEGYVRALFRYVMDKYGIAANL